MPIYLDEQGNEQAVYLSDEETNAPALNNPIGDAFGTDPRAKFGSGVVKGVAQAGRNLGQFFNNPLGPKGRADFSGGMPEELQAQSGEGLGAFVGRAVPGVAAGAAAPMTLSSQMAAGALSGATQGGDAKSAALGAAGGAAVKGASSLAERVAQLAAAIKSGDLSSPVFRAVEALPVIGKQARRVAGAVDLAKIMKAFTEKVGRAGNSGRAGFEAGMAARAAQRAPVEAARAAAAESPAAAAVETGAERAAALGAKPVATSAKRAAETAHKAAVAETRAAGPQLDEVTPELVQQQGVMMAEKQINSALARGDVKAARAILERINKEYGVRLNLRDLSKGKK